MLKPTEYKQRETVKNNGAKDYKIVIQKQKRLKNVLIILEIIFQEKK